MRNQHGDERLPPGQIATTKFPVVHTGTVPKINLSDWDLHVFGAVNNEICLTWDELVSLPKVQYTSDIHCVTTWSRLNNHWEGVSVRDLVQQADVIPEARYAIVYGEQGYSVSLRINDLLREGVMLAYKHDGQGLTPEHGFPLRLVVPDLYFWKSVKWVRGIEFSSENKPGFWEKRGYHEQADAWKEKRYSGSEK